MSDNKSKLRLASISIGITLPEGNPKRKEFRIGVNPYTKTFYFMNDDVPDYLSIEDLTYLAKVVETVVEFNSKLEAVK